MGLNVPLIAEIAKLIREEMYGEAMTLLGTLDQKLASMWWVSNDIRTEGNDSLSPNVHELCSMVEALKGSDK